MLEFTRTCATTATTMTFARAPSPVQPVSSHTQLAKITASEALLQWLISVSSCCRRAGHARGSGDAIPRCRIVQVGMSLAAVTSLLLRCKRVRVRVRVRVRARVS